jgi:rsbT co-antagonist protein RsbR
MTVDPLLLANCEQAFAVSPIPVWVLHLDPFRIVWANPPGLEFWQSESIEALAARDMGGKLPESVLERARRTFAKVEAGNAITEEWTFFPKGKPTMVLLYMRGIILHDGRFALLNQAVSITEEASPAIRRVLAMSHRATATMAFVDSNGAIYSQNPKSLLEFGESKSWITWIVDPEIAMGIIRDALAGQLVEIDAVVKTLQGERIHTIHAQELRDPVAGELGVLVHHVDSTERVNAERLAQEQLLTLQEQQREILALSTPLLDVGEHTLALPLVGRIDEERSAEITSRLLTTIAERRIDRVILDMTGVATTDASNITFLRNLVDAIQLLGARPVVTGIRSEHARTLAASDVDLSGITIKRSLADGLALWRGERKKRG